MSQKRPKYHFTAPKNWINDPNGLIYLDGVYHLFYQHNPYAVDWGHIHWGHAVSTNLLNWEHRPIAIFDTPDFCSFSGSAILDEENSSGFGIGNIAPILLFYTAARKDDYKFQQQHVAYSVDNGQSWRVHEGNPVIPCREKDVRDPKVFWSESADRWVMLLAHAWSHEVGIYHSQNLLEWTQVSAFSVSDAYDCEWECPDLVQLSDPDTGEARWCMIVSIGEGAPTPDSGIQYFLGEFDGTHFTPDLQHGIWIDAGPDFYAAQTWSNLPREADRVVWTAWMSNRNYASKTPASIWRGCHTLPRELCLHNGPDGQIRLAQHPVRELGEASFVQEVVDNTRLEHLARRPMERAIDEGYLNLELSRVSGAGGQFEFRLMQGDSLLFEFKLDYSSGSFQFQRSWGEMMDPPQWETHIKRCFNFEGEFDSLKIFVDESTVEIFSGTGTTVLSSLIFPKSQPISLQLSTEGDLKLSDVVFRMPNTEKGSEREVTSGFSDVNIRRAQA